MTQSLGDYTIQDVVNRLNAGQYWSSESHQFKVTSGLKRVFYWLFSALGLCDSLVQACALDTFSQMKREDLAQGTLLGGSIDRVEVLGELRRLDNSAGKARVAFITTLVNIGFDFKLRQASTHASATPFVAPVVTGGASAADDISSFRRLEKPTKTQVEALQKLLEQLQSRGLFSLGVALTNSSDEIWKYASIVKQVHPFVTCVYLMGQPQLMQQMLALENKQMVMEFFIKEFGQNFSNHLAAGDLIDPIPGFARETGLDEELLRGRIQNRDWKGVLDMFRDKAREKLAGRA